MAKSYSQMTLRMCLGVVALAAAIVDPAHVLFGGDSRAFSQTTAASDKEAFDAAKELGTVEAWDAFLSNYPNGFHADLARAYLKQLAKQTPASAPPPQAVTPRSDEFPVEAGTWGGIVRSGPGPGYAKQDSLNEGDPVSLMGVTPDLDNGYPWFKIWYGRDQRKGYMWGGILCAKGAERPDVYQTCPGTKTSNKGAGCAQSGNQVEQMICANSQLSGLDAQLNSEYNLAVKNITSAAVGGTGADVVKFRREQKDWLRKRDQCGADLNCLTSQYQSRLRFLRDRNQPE